MAVNAAALAGPLSNDVGVPASEESNGRAPLTDVEEGVLANLPRTRPQRTTRRRLAARDAAGAKVPAAETRASTSSTSSEAPASSTRTKSSRNGRPGSSPRARAGRSAKGQAHAAGTSQTPKQRRPSATKRRATAAAEAAPRQGFETEGERPSGPVAPPSGIELAASAAEIVGELTRAGVAAGERLLKDVLSRLPLS